jgi:predicted nuclease of predicted toxin-antitoxin system
MFHLVSDADFNHDVARALKREVPDLDLVGVADVGLARADDPSILAWASNNGRIVITHDRNTMSGFAYERVRAGVDMPGVFIIRNEPPLRKMIDAILLVVGASSQDEWVNEVVFLPL